MDTTNKHIGNVLSKMSDEDIKEVLEQYIKKRNFDSKEQMNDHFDNVLSCDEFDYEGNIVS
jgi:hypothetical protein